MNIEAITEKLVRARGKRSQTEVAKGIGVSTSAIAMYEAGERIPRDEVKEAIAKFYGLTVGFLFFDEEVHETCT